MIISFHSFVIQKMTDTTQFSHNVGGYSIRLKSTPINKKELSDKFDKARGQFIEQMKFDLFKQPEDDIAWGKFADFAQSIVRRNKITFIRDYLRWVAMPSKDDTYRKTMEAYHMYLRYLRDPVDSATFIYPYDVIGSEVHILADPYTVEILAQLNSMFVFTELDEKSIDLSQVTKLMKTLYELVRISLGPTFANYLKSEKFESFNKASVDLVKPKSKIMI